MNSQQQGITKEQLKSYGFTDHLTKEIVRGLQSIQTIGRLKQYSVADVKKSIETKLLNPRTQPRSQQKLQMFLNWLNGETNLIKVDFLRNLPPEEKIEILKDKIQELEIKEKILSQETDDLLMKAKQILKKK